MRCRGFIFQLNLPRTARALLREGGICRLGQGQMRLISQTKRSYHGIRIHSRGILGIKWLDLKFGLIAKCERNLFLNVFRLRFEKSLCLLLGILLQLSLGLELRRTATLLLSGSHRSHISFLFDLRHWFWRLLRGRSGELVGVLHHDQLACVLHPLQVLSQQGRVTLWKVRVDFFYVPSNGLLSRTLRLLQGSNSRCNHLGVRRVIVTGKVDGSMVSDLR